MPQLPIYESRVQLQPFGSVGYESIHAELRSGAALNRSLDKVMEWASGRMESKAKAEAEAYSLENPPNAAEMHKRLTDYVSATTPEEQSEKLKALEAFTRGEVRPENIRQGTVFSESFAKARALQIKASLAALGQEQMALYSQMVESGVDAKGNPIRVEDVRREILARVNGLTSAMAQVDLKAASVLNGELLAHAGPIYNKAIANASAAVVARESVKIDGYMVNAIGALSEAMDNVGADGLLNGVDAAEAFDLYSDNITTNVLAMAQVSPALLKSSMDTAMKEIAKVKLDSLATYFSTDDFAPNVLAAADRLNRGDAGKMSGMFASLPTEEARQSVIKKMFERAATRFEMESKFETMRLAENKRGFIKLYPSWLSETDPAKKDELRSKLLEFQPSAEAAKALFEPNDRPDNIDLRMRLFNQFVRDRRAVPDLITKNAHLLSKGDIDFLMTTYSNSEKKDYDIGMSILKKGANVSDIISFSDTNAKANAQLFARYLKQYDAEIARAKPGDVVDYTGIANSILGVDKKAKPKAKQDGALLGKVNAELGKGKNPIKVQDSFFATPAAYNTLKPRLSQTLRKEIEDKYPGLRK